MPFLHGVRDKGWTRMYQEPRKDRQWAKLEGINEIRNHGSVQQLHPRKERTSGDGIRRRSNR
jgi:hypothetical protein